MVSLQERGQQGQRPEVDQGWRNQRVLDPRGPREDFSQEPVFPSKATWLGWPLGGRPEGAGVPLEGSLEEEEGLGEAAENSRTRPGRLMRPPPGRPLGLTEAWAPGRTQPGPMGPHVPAPRAPTAGRTGRG